jgi:hypothetical protein
MATASPALPGIRSRQISVTRNGRKTEITIDPAALGTIFGVADPELAIRLLGQLASVLNPDPSKPIDAVAVNQVLAIVEGINPTDAVEAMTTTMLVAAQHAALDAMRRALHPEQTPAGRQSYMALSLKAMRTFAQLAESLNHGRGKGVTQRVIVERVNIEPGAQAVVGAVSTRGGGAK